MFVCLCFCLCCCCCLCVQVNSDLTAAQLTVDGQQLQGAKLPMLAPSLVVSSDGSRGAPATAEAAVKHVCVGRRHGVSTCVRCP